MLKSAVVVAGLLFVGACWSTSEPSGQVAKVPPAAPKIAVQMTAATLAEDCGGTAPLFPAAAPTAGKASEKKDMAEAPKGKAKSASIRRCEQTSMQLSVIAPAGGAATTIKVKKVELYDDTGKLIGKLTATSPTVWSDANGKYEAWSQSVAPDAKLSVSYVLSQPDWSGVKDKASHAYTLKAVVTVGAVDQTLEREAEISAPAIVSSPVKT